MEKFEFIKRIEEIKPLLKGRWRQVAERAGVPYVTIHNYIKGFATESDLRVKILNACEEELHNMKKLFDEVY